MANKRQKKKQQKQRILATIPQSKQTKNLSFKELEKTYNYIVAEEEKRVIKERKKQEKYKASLDLLDYKRESLRALGFDEKFLKTSYLRKVKKSDIDAYKKGNEYALGIEQYPFLYDSYGFDFEKVYSFGNTGLYIAWLDYSGEHSIEEIMNRFKHLDNETLIAILDGIVRTKETYDKNAPNRGAGTSSGRAGTVISGFYSDSVAQLMTESNNNRIKDNLENEKKKRAHTLTNKYYQNVVGGGGEYTIKAISGRQLLITLNAIFYNITEESRYEKYNTLYDSITSKVPDFKIILPKP